MKTCVKNTQILSKSLVVLVLLGATAAAQADYTDAVTGLTWTKQTTIAEGEAFGFRAATTDDFKALMANIRMTDSSGTGFYTAGWYNPGGPGAAFESFFNERSQYSYSRSSGSTASTMSFESATMSSGWLDGVTHGMIAATASTYGSDRSGAGKGYNAALKPWSAVEAGALFPDHLTVALRTNYFYMVSVPESGSAAMMGLGMAALFCVSARRRKPR